jgi:hypothetical protein
MARDKPITIKRLPVIAVRPLLPFASRLEVAAATLLLLGAFVLCHRLEVFSALDMQIGGGADPRLIHTICEHWLQVLQGKAEVASPHYFYPQQGTLGYTDAMLGHGLLYALGRSLGLEMFKAYNFMLLALDASNALATLLFLRHGLRLRLLSAALGTVLFVFNSAKFAQIGHAQMLLVFPLPLALWALVELARWPAFTRRTLVLGAALGACLSLQIWSSFYNGWFFGFWLLLASLVALTQRETRAPLLMGLRHHWPAIPVALAVLFTCLMPFVRIYQPVAEQLGWRSYEEVMAMLPQPLSYFSMGEQSLLWGWLPRVFPQFDALPTPWEHHMGVGLVPWLALLGMLAVALRALLRRNASTAHRWALLLAVSALLLLLIPIRIGDASLWHWIYDDFPGGKALRSVTRVILVAALPMAILAAMGLDRLMLKLPQTQHRRVWAGLLAGALVFATVEQTRLWPGHVPTQERARVAEVAAQIAPERCPAFVVRTTSSGPESEIDLQTMAMLAAMQTGVPTLNGYSGKYPYGWDLEKLRAPGYPDRVREWRLRSRLQTPVCVAWLR